MMNNNGHSTQLTYEQEQALGVVKDIAPEFAEAVRVLRRKQLNDGEDSSKLIQSRYVVRTAADALQPQPPIEYVVDKLIKAGSLGIFFGEPGSKKTYSLISLAVCVAQGLDWLNYKTKQGAVLFLDEESGESTMARRLAEALRGEEGDATTPIYYISLAGFLMDDKDDLVILKALIEKIDAQLVIIDALADVMSGDENSKADTQPIFKQLRKIADSTGAAILLIHHGNKQGGYRGSTAIKGAVDLMIKVESEDGKNIIKYSSEKVRHGIPQKWAAIATWLEGEGTFTLRAIATSTNNEPNFTKPERHVINYLTENGASSTEAIVGSAKICSIASARQAIFSLVNKSKVKRINPGKKMAVYELSTCNVV